MATMQEVVDGIKILSGYLEDGMASDLIQAEHDVIYAGGDDKDVTTGDKAKLKALKWHYDESFQSWAKFV